MSTPKGKLTAPMIRALRGYANCDRAVRRGAVMPQSRPCTESALDSRGLVETYFEPRAGERCHRLTAAGWAAVIDADHADALVENAEPIEDMTGRAVLVRVSGTRHAMVQRQTATRILVEYTTRTRVHVKWFRLADRWSNPDAANDSYGRGAGGEPNIWRSGETWTPCECAWGSAANIERRRPVIAATVVPNTPAGIMVRFA